MPELARRDHLGRCWRPLKVPVLQVATIKTPSLVLELPEVVLQHSRVRCAFQR